MHIQIYTLSILYSIFIPHTVHRHTYTSLVVCQCETCSLMLSLTFAGLNPDILQANLNFLVSCCGLTSTAHYIQKVP